MDCKLIAIKVFNLNTINKRRRKYGAIKIYIYIILFCIINNKLWRRDLKNIEIINVYNSPLFGTVFCFAYVLLYFVNARCARFIATIAYPSTTNSIYLYFNTRRIINAEDIETAVEKVIPWFMTVNSVFSLSIIIIIISSLIGTNKHNKHHTEPHTHTQTHSSWSVFSVVICFFLVRLQLRLHCLRVFIVSRIFMSITL